MRPLHKLIRLATLVAASSALAPLDAQTTPPSLSTSSEDESHQRPPAFTTGLGAGVMHFSSGRSESAISATLQYSPHPWLTLSAAPGFGRTTLGRATSSGLTDLPLTAGVIDAFSELPWSPSVSASLYTTLSMGDSTSAVALGRTVSGASAAVSGWATDQLNLTASASHPFNAGGGNGSIDLEAAYSLGVPTATLGVSSEVGHADSAATLARSIAGGLAFAVHGPLALTIDGSHGLTPGAPSWSISVGLGTAFAGISPLNPSSPLRRLNKVFGSRVTSTSGYKKGGTGSSSCKVSRTC
jgi:hypothetical protein